MSEAVSTPEYQIVAQTYRTEVSPDARGTVNGWRVTFKDTQTGVSGDVFVAEDFYTPENVRTLILDKLQAIRAVHALTS